jgi:CRP-like cAMP-binding protein
MGLQGIPLTVADGEVIFSRGDAAADMYIVRSGSVDIVAWGTDGPVVLEHIEAGGFFGEMALFSPGPRSASAVARGETVLDVVDTPTFQAFVGDPMIWAVCARLSDRLRRATAAALEDDE